MSGNYNNWSNVQLIRLLFHEPIKHSLMLFQLTEANILITWNAIFLVVVIWSDSRKPPFFQERIRWNPNRATSNRSSCCCSQGSSNLFWTQTNLRRPWTNSNLSGHGLAGGSIGFTFTTTTAHLPYDRHTLTPLLNRWRFSMHWWPDGSWCFLSSVSSPATLAPSLIRFSWNCLLRPILDFFFLQDHCIFHILKANGLALFCMANDTFER